MGIVWDDGCGLWHVGGQEIKVKMTSTFSITNAGAKRSYYFKIAKFCHFSKMAKCCHLEMARMILQIST
jgi:hypothetical protein